MKQTIFKIIVMVIMLPFFSCKDSSKPNASMVSLLSDIAKNEYNKNNNFSPEAKLAFYDSILNTAPGHMQLQEANYYKAKTLLELGREKESIRIFQELLPMIGPMDRVLERMVLKEMAMTYMRLGERINCVHNHGVESCIFPIQNTGVHLDKAPSARAIEIYEDLLKEDPGDLESRWLLNIAYMTIGRYPDHVPQAFLIEQADTASYAIKPFSDVALNTGLNTTNMAGGSIVDDFNNDGYLDIVSSSWDLAETMHYCTNNGNGTFTDRSEPSGLQYLTGGLHIMQTDYNNDGFKDIFVMRGGWKGVFGKEPNSLLRNNGDDSFTDVTVESGLLSFHPTQTATWNDFNNDGWLDVFIGNESSGVETHPSELYINNKNGTFTDISVQSGTNVHVFAKGVSSGDYDNDGWPDIFISTMDGQKILFRNEGLSGGIVHFKDVAGQAGLGNNRARTFPAWFWDYDNDGWLDILVCGYEFERSLAYYAAAESLNVPVENFSKQFLFRNKQDGTFEDVTDKVGLNKTAFAMGSNFGDIDNDGYSDIYLGTGNPFFQSLVPNKMFKNEGGTKFIDITAPARVGNLQKGHGVCFADLDSDGDEDIYIDMGGAYTGDAYQNSLYLNPGQNNNGWINISLEGAKCNRAAIGARVKVTFKENGITRAVCRDVNSGGSFGANPLLQHIGIGNAAIIESIEIKWPVSNALQVLKNIRPRQTIKIKEGNNAFETIKTNKVDFSVVTTGLIPCAPR